MFLRRASLNQLPFGRLKRVCLAKRLKLGNGRALVLVNRLCICLENARVGMAHYLSHKDGGHARLFGPNFSEYVFPKPGHPATHLRDVRAAWANALSAAGLEHFWIYDLRHTFASRVTQPLPSQQFGVAPTGLRHDSLARHRLGLPNPD